MKLTRRFVTRRKRAFSDSSVRPPLRKRPILPMNQSPDSTAPDLNSAFPRSPRNTLGGFVVAARTLDKCRAVLAGTAGEYHFDCPLDHLLFDFTGITADEFKAKVAEGLSDEAFAEWLPEKTAISKAVRSFNGTTIFATSASAKCPLNCRNFLRDISPNSSPQTKSSTTGSTFMTLKRKEFNDSGAIPR